MTPLRSLVLAALAAAAAALQDGVRAAAGTEVTPVEKVVGLLTGMMQKGKEEKHEEQVQFAAFSQFCDDTTKEKTRTIKEENEMIDMLQADVAKYTAEAAQLAGEIAGHDDDISTWEGDAKATTKVREIENADYLRTHKDYTESIDALANGVVTLKAQVKDVAQASAALAQVTGSQLLARVLPEGGRRAIEAFLAQDPDENLAVAAPEANAYEAQSAGIVDMLMKLQLKFEDERTELEKVETLAKGAYEVLSQDLRMKIEQGTATRTEKSEAKAKALQNAADAKGQLEDVTTTRDDDSKYLSDLTAECQKKSSAFEARQKMRAAEIEALEKACAILSSGAVAGAAKEHLPGLLQSQAKAKTTKSASFAQLRSVKGEEHGPAQLRVAAFLKAQAGRFNSRLLSALATKVSEDPFKKVKKMIKDLIVKLMEEANEEAEHKGWCDTELSTNEHTRKEKTEQVEMLHADIDGLDASIGNIVEEITELTKGVADLDAAVQKATAIREAEKAKNANTVKDARDASTAVAQALALLKEFYAKAGEATALVQQPDIFTDEAYKGMGAENGGVVAMIEVIQSDFARLESETLGAEADADKAHTAFMKDSLVDKAKKNADIDHLNSKKQDQEQALTERKADLDGSQQELDAALAYFEKLKPSCIDAGTSYEDRVARRKEEIESLQEALRILNGEDVGAES